MSGQRKIILDLAVSLDGYIKGKKEKLLVYNGARNGFSSLLKND